jgi:hypothetical protein
MALAEEIRERVKREHGIDWNYEVELWSSVSEPGAAATGSSERSENERTMKEQVISSRPARRGAPSAKAGAQRPARATVKNHRDFLRAFACVRSDAMKVAFGILRSSVWPSDIALHLQHRCFRSARRSGGHVTDVGPKKLKVVRRAVRATGVWRTDFSALSAAMGDCPAFVAQSSPRYCRMVCACAY